MLFTKRHLTTLLLIIGTQLLAVNISFGQSFEELNEKFSASTTLDSTLFYAKKFLKKAKDEKDSIKIYDGYSLFAYTYDSKDCIIYADSLIALTKDKSKYNYTAWAYFYKANYFLNNLDFGKALDNISSAEEYAKLNNNDSFILSRCNTILGMTKIKVGDFNGAIKVFHHGLVETTKDTIKGEYYSYVSNLFNLASVYNEVLNLDSASYYNELGITIAQHKGQKLYYQYFKFNTALTEFHKKNYGVAKEALKNLLPFFEENKDPLNLFESYYYLGKINVLQGNEKEALKYFNKIDSNYTATNNFYPKYRDAYHELIKITSANNETELNLDYVQKLLSLDSIISADNIYVNTKISNEFDTPKLLAEKEHLEQLLLAQKEEHEQLRSAQSRKARNYLYWLIPLLIIVILILGYQFYLRRSYMKKSKILMEEIKTTKDAVLHKNEKSQNEALEIPDKILQSILINLEKFEHKEGYLNPNLRISQLAKKVGSNTKYVSRVINEYKGASFSDYINGLRINHAIKRLKNDRKFMNYTVKAIAIESGFNQAESFAKAFDKQTNIKPSQYIKDLKKESEFTENRET